MKETVAQQLDKAMPLSESAERSGEVADAVRQQLDTLERRQ